ncbi:MAG TPA: UDP-2,3-diacylglucosamine diphosphatase LpxI [Blastocatellia bacterium]|nr:UDP-2,3-diacylglucosamine diphosphatase LpxI [Blastocatellia bacterium]
MDSHDKAQRYKGKETLPPDPRPLTPDVRYGLIAGNGRFPFLILEGARARGVEMVVAAIKEETEPEIEALASRIEWIGVGQLGRLIRFFKREQVTHAIMAGQVKHHQIFRLNALPDLRMVRLLARLSTKNTDSLIGAVAAELAREGITLAESTIFLEQLLAREGVLSRRAPAKEELADIEYGLEVAREIARLDLGQTIAVKDRAVVAVEAMEGTDAVIARAGEITRRRPFVVVKVARPDQDMRFDVPVIGPPTIENMARAGATAISVTAGKTLLFDQEDLIALADKYQISIIGV